MGDLFGFLFLFLIEKKTVEEATVEEATEENRFSACNAVVDHQAHALCCFQSTRLFLCPRRMSLLKPRPDFRYL